MILKKKIHGVAGAASLSPGASMMSARAPAVAARCGILTCAMQVAAVPGVLCICAACKKDCL